MRRKTVTMLAAAMALAAGSARAEISAANKAAIDAFYGTFNAKNFARFEAAVTPDWDDVPPAPGQKPGRDAFQPVLGYFFKAFPDLKVVNDKIVADGDFVVVRSTLSGTQAGEFSHMEPSNKPFSIVVMDMHRMQDGKIAQTWHVEDWLGMMFQTGHWPNK